METEGEKNLTKNNNAVYRSYQAKLMGRMHLMSFTRVVHGSYLSVPFPSHSNLCLSHPMGRFP